MIKNHFSANPEDYDSVTALAAIRIKQGKKSGSLEIFAPCRTTL